MANAVDLPFRRTDVRKKLEWLWEKIPPGRPGVPVGRGAYDRGQGDGGSGGSAGGGGDCRTLGRVVSRVALSWRSSSSPMS